MERTEGLLERGAGVEVMVVEDVHVVETHPGQALIQACQQVLARAQIAVGARPHVPTSLGRDEQLVAVITKVGVKDSPEVAFGGSVRRPVVVLGVEMRFAPTEGASQDGSLGAERPLVAEVLPQSERHTWQQHAASTAAAVGHRVVAVVRGNMARGHGWVTSRFCRASSGWPRLMAGLATMIWQSEGR